MDSKSNNLGIKAAAINLFTTDKLAADLEMKTAATINYLKRIIYCNEIKAKEKRLVFVSGVPGSGKTMAALKLLYDYNVYKLEEYQQDLAGVYLSRNKMLISELKQLLKNQDTKLKDRGEDYVRTLADYKWEHMNNPKLPKENLVIFDDAQRARDGKKIKSSDSEADFILKNGHKIYQRKGNVTIICFIDEGQSIYLGEEEGIRLWDKSLDNSWINQWHVYAPAKYEKLFQKADSLTINNSLELATSLRSNCIDTTAWMEKLLTGDLVASKASLIKMIEAGFIIRITRDFAQAKNFIKQQAKKSEDLNYGLLVSSKARQRELKYQINDGRYFGSYLEEDEVKQWFGGKNKELETGASEFACQGLELDFPLVCFGGDYYYNGQEWEIEENVKRYHAHKYHDFEQIVENIYRVLLSRACQGMLLYIPKLDRLDQTYQLFLELGISEIKPETRS